MTSLAVQLNYNNISVANENHRIIRNPNSNNITTNSNNNNNNNMSNTHPTLSSNTNHLTHNHNIANNGGGLQQFNSHYSFSNNKMPSPNIIYNLKTGNGIGCGTIMESK